MKTLLLFLILFSFRVLSRTVCAIRESLQSIITMIALVEH